MSIGCAIILAIGMILAALVFGFMVAIGYFMIEDMKETRIKRWLDKTMDDVHEKNKEKLKDIIGE